MATLEIDHDMQMALKARSHHVDTVVLIGHAGISPAILKEIDRALSAHELIKVRIPGNDRDQRDLACVQIAEEVSAARVALIGKTLVLFRPLPLLANAAAKPMERRPPIPQRRLGSARSSKAKPVKRS